MGFLDFRFCAASLFSRLFPNPVDKVKFCLGSERESHNMAEFPTLAAIALVWV
jgi:hypothetical protein